MKIEISNIQAQRELLMDAGADFVVSLSGSTRKIIHGEIEYISVQSRFNIDEIRFIKKVRNEIIKNCEDYEKVHKVLPAYKCQYVNWADTLPFNCSNICEIDINSAYWQMAWQMGYINSDTYNEGFNHRKKIRLAALGSIAKNEKTIYFKGGKFVRAEASRHKYSKAFFNISRYIYDIMAICKAVLGDQYLFFWVDAIFFKKSPRNIGLVLEVLKDAQMEYKMYPIEKFEFSKDTDTVIVTSSIHKQKIRQFNLKKESKW